MATAYYDVPRKVTLTNLSDKTIKFQLYRVNLWEEIEAGNDCVLTADASEECVYYQNLAICFGTDEDGVPNVLRVDTETV